MNPLTLVVVAFVVALVLFGFAFWTPIYAIPICLVFLAGLGAYEVVRRSRLDAGVRHLRERAPGARDVHFTDRDRETLYERD